MKEKNYSKIDNEIVMVYNAHFYFIFLLDHRPNPINQSIYILNP